MLEKMKEIIAEQLSVDADSITEASSFKDDLGADSLDLFELVMALEDEYSVEIPAEDLQNLATVGDVMNYLKKRCRGIMKTKITEMLGIEYPIIQGGMAWVAEHHLAAAVSEAGGLGLSWRRQCTR